MSAEYRVMIDGRPLSFTTRSLDEAMQQAALYQKYRPTVQSRTVTEWEDLPAPIPVPEEQAP